MVSVSDCGTSTKSSSSANTKLDDSHGVVDISRTDLHRRRYRFDGDFSGNSRATSYPRNEVGGSTNPQDELNGKYNEQDRKPSRAVTVGREVFILFILVVAGVLGFLAHFLSTQAEVYLARRQYLSLTEGALLNIRNLAENKLVHGTQIMAKHVGWIFPNASDWPFVWAPSYWDVMEDVLPTSIWSGVNLAPIVQPEEAPAFEDFAYGKFAETFGENTTMGATSHFGKGIWVQDPLRVNTSDHRYHDTTGIPLYDGSPYHYLAPKLQDGLIYTPYTMMNVHGFEIQGKSLDAVMNCSFARKENSFNEEFVSPQGCNDSEGSACAPNPKKSRCSALSGMLPPKNIKQEHGIAGFIATPIYPANDPFELVGYIFGIVYWVEVMIDIFPKNTKGVDCVFEDHDYTYTFTIQNNTSRLVCEGDCHDRTYDALSLTTQVVDPNLVSEYSARYDVTCYPNAEFFEVYTTSNPRTAAIGAACIMLLTSALFFLYDYCVRREFLAKKHLFEAKRKFVRFVSHEVRTPMNSVCMGLSILQEETASALGYATSDSANGNYSSAPEAGKGREQIERWLDLANDISTNAHAAVEVLDDFLNYDKIASGELSLEYTIVGAWNLIQDTVSEFKLPLAKKKIRIHVTLPNASSLQGSNRESRFGAIVRQTSIKLFKKDLSQKSIGSAQNDFDIECGLEDMYSFVQSLKIVGDSVRLTQVMRNLLSNAIKFSREEGDIFVSTQFEPVKERTKAEKTFELKSKKVVTYEQRGNIIVKVKDTGVGMSPSQLKDLFQSGVQFDVNDLQAGKGSGLGLYISKGIIEQHGGKLSAESEGLGMGTTFTVKLPIYKVPNKDDKLKGKMNRRESGGSPTHARDTSMKTQKTWPTSCSNTEINGEDCNNQDISEDREDSIDGDMERSDHPPLTNLKILLIDDSNSNRKLLDRLLSMRGHKCEHAEDGHIGVEMVMKAEEFAQPYDMIFVDYEMPTLNGPEAVKKIRNDGCDVFVIGVTGNIMRDDVKHFKDCGANMVLPKPFKIKRLESILKQNLTYDNRGRVVEKASGELDTVTMDFLQQCEGSISTLGYSDSTYFDISTKSQCNIDLDETGKSLETPFE